MNPNLTYWVEGNSCCNHRWEDAYNHFESETEETNKFLKRLYFLGAQDWNRNARVVDLFCGSGRNLTCLERLGFKDLHGVDLSPRLLLRCTGNSKLYVGDVTNLKFPDAWADIVIVQGGLHHLPNLHVDLEKCLSQVQRVLKPGGVFIMVEPWLTPFLRFVHWCCRRKSLRMLSKKLNSLATMIEEEKDTYFKWLSEKSYIIKCIEKKFMNNKIKLKFGKIYLVSIK
jgi:SAM-dependent methyltransferase